jgi:HlyD family secretion protein
VAWRSVVVLLSIAATVLIVRVLLRRDPPGPQVPVQPVGRQDIVVTIEATGTVEPIDLIEIKSKASGLILRMPVKVGSQVQAGDLLAQIDTVDVENQYQQALAALRAAQAKVDISSAQMKRADELFAQQVITTDEHESATLDFANAQAALVTARTNLDIARQRRDDATVRAPVAGTVLQQTVTAGQVISSATSSASGGTSLLEMADLRRIRMRALVSETDIGSVQHGQRATVTVHAFPQRPFVGTVEQIEPQAVVQQSVTMFPVLISISNEDGSLLPGMNGEVSMLVNERDDVLAVPVDAVRSVRELPAVASALGLDLDSLRAEIQRQQAARWSEQITRGGSLAGSVGGSSAMGRGAAGGDSSGTRRRWRSRGGFGSDSARAGRWMGRGGSGRFPGARGAGGGFGGAGGVSGGGSFGTSDAFGASAPTALAAGSGGRGSRDQVVFVKTARGLEPRRVRLGLTNFDYAEVLDGVKEGEQVALLSVAELQARRKQDQSRIRERLGGGVPGVPSGGGRGPQAGR